MQIIVYNVFKWYKKVKYCSESVEDKPRPSRPQTDKNRKN